MENLELCNVATKFWVEILKKKSKEIPGEAFYLLEENFWNKIYSLYDVLCPAMPSARISVSDGNPDSNLTELIKEDDVLSKLTFPKNVTMIITDGLVRVKFGIWPFFKVIYHDATC